MAATEEIMAATRAQNALLDLEIKLLQDHILRLDAMIDECAKIKRDLGKVAQ